MTAPAISGPTDAMNRMLAMTIIQTTIGMSNIFMPGAAAFITVVTKLMPPSRKATNSSATAMSHSGAPAGVRLYWALADSGGYAGPRAAEGAAVDEEARRCSTSALSRKIW